jgi:acetyl-CoA carboxylase biotin carboxyl carrier protein
VNIEDLKELIRTIDSSNLSEFKMEKCDIKIYMKKENEIRVIRDEKAFTADKVSAELIPTPASQEKIEVQKQEDNLHVIKSPMVGVFYASPTPEDAPYVKPGDRVKKGDVLCIVEAMKLMNEIISDADGEIVEVLGENQSPIEYGQPLFKIRRV